MLKTSDEYQNAFTIEFRVPSVRSNENCIVVAVTALLGQIRHHQQSVVGTTNLKKVAMVDRLSYDSSSAVTGSSHRNAYHVCSSMFLSELDRRHANFDENNQGASDVL